MAEVNLLRRYPQSKRNVQSRSAAKTDEHIRISRQYGFEYFDGPREYGYGGFRYDGRWVPIAEDIIAHFGLKPGMRVLDVPKGDRVERALDHALALDLALRRKTALAGIGHRHDGHVRAGGAHEGDELRLPREFGEILAWIVERAPVLHEKQRLSIERRFQIGEGREVTHRHPPAACARPAGRAVRTATPADHDLIKLVYAEGSQSGYAGRTVFAYIVTNVARGGMAREEFLDASQITPGDYTLRVFAEDFFGNQARRDTPIIVTSPIASNTN